jgi:serine/threonine protein kinase
VVGIYACALTRPHFVSCRNIGSCVRGNYKLFDFGLAKELRKEDLAEAPDGFVCTGLTGSRRWMAPENCLCKNYGLSADVYAYSSVLARHGTENALCSLRPGKAFAKSNFRREKAGSKENESKQLPSHYYL